MMKIVTLAIGYQLWFLGGASAAFACFYVASLFIQVGIVGEAALLAGHVLLIACCMEPFAFSCSLATKILFHIWGSLIYHVGALAYALFVFYNFRYLWGL